MAGFGRFGPYIQHDGKYASLGTPEEVFEIGLNRAVTLLAEKAASSRGRRGANVIKELGEHPDAGGKVQVLTGRYGPYVKHGKINATLPKDREPEQVTLEEAVVLIAARRRPRARAKKKPAKKPGAQERKEQQRGRRGDGRLSGTRGEIQGGSRKRTQDRGPSFPPSRRFSIFSRPRPAKPASARSRAPSASKAATASR